MPLRRGNGREEGKGHNRGSWRASLGLRAALALLARLLSILSGSPLALADEAHHVNVTFLLTSDVYKLNEERGRGGLPRIARS
jgi:hypothetical protein